MLDPWDLFAAAKRGDVAFIRAELGRGFDPNAACEYTGTTALLSACEGDQLEAVRVLLHGGANPDARHHDGYDCWDTTRSRAVREALLEGGFSLVLDGTTGGRGLWSRRLLVPRAPMSGTWERTLEGVALFVEVLRTDFPVACGEVCVRVTGAGPDVEVRPEPGSHGTVALEGGTARVEIGVVGFVGELKVRVWAEEVVAGNSGPREFWVPRWGV